MSNLAICFYFDILFWKVIVFFFFFFFFFFRYVKQYGNQWAKIGKKIGRMGEACRDRHRGLIAAWTPDELVKFHQGIKQITGKSTQEFIAYQLEKKAAEEAEETEKNERKGKEKRTQTIEEEEEEMEMEMEMEENEKLGSQFLERKNILPWGKLSEIVGTKSKYSCLRRYISLQHRERSHQERLKEVPVIWTSRLDKLLLKGFIFFFFFEKQIILIN
mgnify:CR=1 FL=1